MDILAALSDATPQQGEKRCKLAASLADIPEDAPGRDQLLEATFGEDALSGAKLSLVYKALGFTVSPTVINGHRGAYCACYR